MKGTLIIFARAPRLGGVKRRLASEIGRREALRFHVVATRSLVRRLGRDRRWRTVLAVTAESGFWPGRMPRFIQRGKGLGARMAHALAVAPAGPAIIVGSDIPGMTAAHIASAFRSLGAADAVFGPAGDGGYWLVGIRNRILLRGLFRNVRWGTEHALVDTLANMPAGRRYALIDMLEDVDDGAAWKRWRDEISRRGQP